MVPNYDFLLELQKFWLFKMQLEKGALQDEDTVLELAGWRVKFLIPNPFFYWHSRAESDFSFFFFKQSDINYALLLNSNQIIQMQFNF